MKKNKITREQLIKYWRTIALTRKSGTTRSEFELLFRILYDDDLLLKINDNLNLNQKERSDSRI